MPQAIFVTAATALRLVEDCVAAVRGGGNLIVFPEGTRTPADGSISLKRGAANIAVRAPCDITPVLVRCAPPMLIKERTLVALAGANLAVSLRRDGRYRHRSVCRRRRQ